MHPVNRLLDLIGLRLSRTSAALALNIPKDFRQQYNRQLDELRKESRGFRVFQEFRYDLGHHPQSYVVC